MVKEVNEDSKDILRNDMKHLELTKYFVKSSAISF